MIDTGATQTSVPVQDQRVLLTWAKGGHRPNVMTVAGPCRTEGDGEVTLRFTAPHRAPGDPPQAYATSGGDNAGPQSSGRASGAKLAGPRIIASRLGLMSDRHLARIHDYFDRAQLLETLLPRVFIKTI